MEFVRFIRENANWLAVGLILSFTSSFGQTYFISIFAGEIMGAFALTDGAWGGAYTTGTAASAIVMVWAGGLTDIFRVRILAPAIFILLAVACIFMALNTNPFLLPVVVFCLRLTGQGMSSQMMTVAMARWFTKNRGRALAVASMGFAIGQAGLPYIFVQAKDIVDWRTLWLVAAAISAFAIVPLVLLLRTERTPQSIASQSVSLGMYGKHWTRRDMFRNPLFWCLVPAILGPSAWNTALFFQQVHLTETKALSHQDFVGLLPLYTGVAVAATFISGWAIDRIGAGWLMAFQSIPMVFGFLVISGGNDIGDLALAMTLIGVSSGAMATLPGSFAAEYYGTRHIGGIKAIWAAIMVLGSAIGPGITGWLIDLGIDFSRQSVGIAIYFMVSTAILVFGVGRANRSLTSAP